MTRAGVNRAILVGYLNSDPERRTLQSGDPVVNFTLCTPEVWEDRHSGEERTREEQHRVAIFNEGLSQVASDFLRKGSWIYICGTLRTRHWIDAGGVQRDTSESLCLVLAASCKCSTAASPVTEGRGNGRC